MVLGSKGRLIRPSKDIELERWAKNVAWGVALGASIGIIPKFSAAWGLLFLVVFFLPVSILALVFSTILFSLVGPLIDPLSGQVGAVLLNIPAVASSAKSLDTTPIVSWFRLNHPSVLGSIAIGCVAIIPLAMVLKSFFVKGRELYSATNRHLATTTVSEGSH